jgi:hypothetical protein
LHGFYASYYYEYYKSRDLKKADIEFGNAIPRQTNNPTQPHRSIIRSNIYNTKRFIYLLPAVQFKLQPQQVAWGGETTSHDTPKGSNNLAILPPQHGSSSPASPTTMAPALSALSTAASTSSTCTRVTTGEAAPAFLVQN